VPDDAVGSALEVKDIETAGRIDVSVSKKARTITVRDNGIGMDADEVKKYIGSIALSGAMEFIEKYESTSMRPAVSMSLTSPSEIRRCSLTIASEALETISRRKISLSEYSQRLMTGKIFLVSTEMPPFSFIICSDMKISFL